jgi:multicomponent Na+:H+ antiporter subunit E
VRTVLARSLGLFALWLVLIRSAQPADLLVGALTVAVATWLSLRLLPPEAGRVRLKALAGRLPRFLWQSVRAGIDVARRAFAPRPPLAPGFATHPTGLPRGVARNTFATITSLVPGTVPVHDDADGILYHCLDTRQPVLQDLAAEERVYAPALAPERTGA